MSDHYENQMVPYSFFQSVIDLLPIAVDIINEDKVSVLRNAVFNEMFSWQEDYPFTDELEQVFLFRTAINTYLHNVSTLTETGCSYHLLVEPLFEHSEVIGAIVVIQDITNLFKYQQENEQLTTTINQLKDQLEQIMQTNKEAQCVEEDIDGSLQTIEEIQLVIDYTSRDNDTWLAIRDLRQNIKRSMPTYFYGEAGLGKRLLIEQVVSLIKGRHYQWYDIQTNSDIEDLQKDIELNNKYFCISIKNQQMTVDTLRMLHSLSNIANRGWIVIGETVPLVNDELWNMIKQIRIPSLRERKSDVLLLVDKMLPQGILIHEDVKKKFIQYHWPKNISELRAVLRYADSLRLYGQNAILMEHIGPLFPAPNKLQDNREQVISDAKQVIDSSKKESVEKDVYKTKGKMSDQNALDILLQSINQSDKSMPDIFEAIEKKYIEQILQQTQFNITHTASKLGIKRQALQYKLKKYNLVTEETLNITN